ncbi:MAG: RHS repeat-associated core domain-containing protein [Chloroflexi bacterium]|nr:RHS repeat-associated core domain-containing protein [Chloroflexota bacterium]
MGDASQEIIFSQSYDPYGNVLNTVTAGLDSNYGFTGEWTDANDLVHLRARYYAPAMGRFMSRDTWAGDHLSPLSLNRWNYVKGNPVNLLDPSGLAPIGGGGAILGVTFSAENHATWSHANRMAVYNGVADVAFVLSDFLVEKGHDYIPPVQLVNRFFGGLNFHMTNQSTWKDANNNKQKDIGEYYYCARTTGEPEFYPPGVLCYLEAQEDGITPRLVIHEIGHVYNATVSNFIDKNPNVYIDNPYTPYDESLDPYDQLSVNGIFYENEQGERIQLAGLSNGEYIRFTAENSGLSFTENSYRDVNEDFADTFANWVVACTGGQGLLYDLPGNARREWMEYRLYLDLTRILGLPSLFNPDHCYDPLDYIE